MKLKLLPSRARRHSSKALIPLTPDIDQLSKQPLDETGSVRLPHDAKPDIALTQVKLLAKVTPEDDDVKELLTWLQQRGFFDVIALKYESSMTAGASMPSMTGSFKAQEPGTEPASEGLDLALWVSHDRLRRTEINRNPSTVPTAPSDLTPRQRTILVQESTRILECAKVKGIISYHKMFLMHDKGELAEIKRLHHAFDFKQFTSAVQEYFGSKVGFYFAWLQYTTVALVLPALFGLAIWYRGYAHREAIISKAAEEGVEPLLTAAVACAADDASSICAQGDLGAHTLQPVWEDPWLPIFNIFLAVWATLYLKFWARQSAFLAYEWKVHQADSIARAKRLVGWDFDHLKRTLKMDELKPPEQQTYSAEVWEAVRLLRLVVTVSAELLILYAGIRVMLLFEWLQYHAEEIYGDHGWAESAVRVSYAILPGVFSGLHQAWAQKTTDWEGHVSPAAAENVYVAKLFAYQFVNAYCSLFYIAFWQRDMGQLQEMLTTLLVTRQIVAVVGAVVKPRLIAWLKKHFLAQKLQKQSLLKAGKGCTEAIFRPGEARLSQCWMKQGYLRQMNTERFSPPLQVYEEYLELVVQFGYVTMFAVAFPLAPLLALARYVMEFWIDSCKIIDSRRPAYIQRSSIGAWAGVLEILGMCAVGTNCLLLGLVNPKVLDNLIPTELSRQFPHIKYLLIVVIVEHAIMGIKMLVKACIDDIPADVERSMAQEMLAEQQRRRRQMLDESGFANDVATYTPYTIRHRRASEIPNSKSCITHTAVKSGVELVSSAHKSAKSLIQRSNSVDQKSYVQLTQRSNSTESISSSKSSRGDSQSSDSRPSSFNSGLNGHFKKAA